MNEPMEAHVSEASEQFIGQPTTADQIAGLQRNLDTCRQQGMEWEIKSYQHHVTELEMRLAMMGWKNRYEDVERELQERAAEILVARQNIPQLQKELEEMTKDRDRQQKQHDALRTNIQHAYASDSLDDLKTAIERAVL